PVSALGSRSGGMRGTDGAGPLRASLEGRIRLAGAARGLRRDLHDRGNAPVRSHVGRVMTRNDAAAARSMRVNEDRPARASSNWGRALLISKIFDFTAIPLILAGLYLAFLYAPRESTMGDVQRIFYFHVPFALNSFLAFGVVLVASIGFLLRGKRSWDETALAAVEVG